jgi:hypothetical protein
MYCCSFVFRHVKLSHKEVYSNYQKLHGPQSNSNQSTLDGHVILHCESYGAKHARQSRITSSLVSNLIVGCSLPLSIVENVHFRSFVAELDNKYTLPSRSHVASRLIPDLLLRKKDAVSRRLSGCKNVAENIVI